MIYAATSANSATAADVTITSLLQPPEGAELPEPESTELPESAELPESGGVTPLAETLTVTVYTLLLLPAASTA